MSARIQRCRFCHSWIGTITIFLKALMMITTVLVLTSCGNDRIEYEPSFEQNTFSIQVESPNAEIASVGLAATDLELRVTIAGKYVEMVESTDKLTRNGGFSLPEAGQSNADNAELHIVWHQEFDGVLLPLVSAGTIKLNNSSSRFISVALFNNSEFDYDFDGRSNLAELSAGTNPLVPFVEVEVRPLEDGQALVQEQIPEPVSSDLYTINKTVFYEENDANGAPIRGGVFRLSGNGQWIESKIDLESLEEERFAIFREVKRDIAGILIHDDSRDLSILLNIDGGKIFWGSGPVANGLLYSMAENLRPQAALPAEYVQGDRPVQDDKGDTSAQDDVVEPLLLDNSPNQAPVLYQDFVAAFYYEADATGRPVLAGVFRNTSNDTWVEYKIDLLTLGETRFSTFGEVRRDSDGILLFDATRNLSVNLAINRDEIYVGSGEEANGLLFSIVEKIDKVDSVPHIEITSPELPVDSDTPPDVRLPPTASSDVVSPDGDPSLLYPDTLEVFYQQSDEKEAGVFRFDGLSQWVELKIDNTTRVESLFSSFTELKRADDGILLYDGGRDLSIRLDIIGGNVYFGNGKTADSLLYSIVDSLISEVVLQPDEQLNVQPEEQPDVQSEGNSPSLYSDVVAVFYDENRANAIGVFRKISKTLWEERKINTSTGIETSFARFNEERRDTDGIFLIDSTRDLSIRLAVNSGQVFFGSVDVADSFLFPIIAVGNSVFFYQNLDATDPSETAGVFRLGSDGIWGEYKIDANGREGDSYLFRAVAQDAFNVMLYDKERDLSIRLDLREHVVLFGDGLEAFNLLYRIVDTTVPGFELRLEND